MKITKKTNGGIEIDGCGITVIHLLEGDCGSEYSEHITVDSEFNDPKNSITGFTVVFHKTEEARQSAINNSINL